MKKWYAIKTKPKREDFAAANLRGVGLETLSPKISRYEKLFGNSVLVERALFPSYIFSKFDVFDNYRRVKYAAGVKEVVTFGEGPTPIDDAIITAIQDRLNKNDFLETIRGFDHGDVVKISEGPLKGLIGTLQQEVCGSERVAVLLNTIGYQARIVIDSSHLEKLGSN